MSENQKDQEIVYPPNFHHWTDFANYSEKDYLNYLKKRLPKGYYVIHSVYVKSGKIYQELDFVVLCPGNVIYVVEQKYWKCKIVGNDNEFRAIFPDYAETRKSPFVSMQHKQRYLEGVIKKIRRAKSRVTSMLVIGSPSKSKFPFELEGNIANISFTPEDTIKELLKHRDKPKSPENTYRELKKHLEKISMISISSIKLKSVKANWNIEIKSKLKKKSDSLYLDSTIGDIKYSNDIEIFIRTRTDRSKLLGNFYHIHESLTQRILYFLKIEVLQNSKYRNNIKYYIEAICNSWFNSIKNGKLIDNTYLSPIRNFKTSKDIYETLSGGFVSIEKDYHPMFKEFRKQIDFKINKQNANLVLIVGNVGSGKTTQLCRYGVEELQSHRSVYGFNHGQSLPDNLNIDHSLILVDNFVWMNPKDILKLQRSAVKNKNVIIGCLREEFLGVLENNYLRETDSRRVPWEIVSIPEIKLSQYTEIFSELMVDWGLNYPPETLDAIIYHYSINITNLADMVKSPQRKIGYLHETEALLAAKTGSLQLGHSAIMLKKLRLLGDIVFFSDSADKGKILKSIFYLSQLPFGFPQFFYEDFKSNLDLVDQNNGFIQGFLTNDYFDHQKNCSTWLNIFALVKGGYFSEKILHSPHPGEKAEFLNIIKSLDIDKWSKTLKSAITEFEKSKISHKFSNLGVVEELPKLDIFGYLVLLSYKIVDPMILANIDKTDWLLFLGDLKDFDISLLNLLLSNSLPQYPDSSSIIEKILLSIQDPTFEGNSSKFHYIIALRNIIEEIYENQIFYDAIKELTDLVVTKYEIFAKWTSDMSDTTKYGSFPIELTRITSHVSKDLTSKYLEYINQNDYLHPHFNPIIKIYQYENNTPLLHKLRVKSLMNISYDLIWDPIAYNEEIILFKRIIEELEHYKRLIPALICCLLAQEIIRRKHEMSHKSVLIQFQDKSLSLAKKTGNWQLVETIQKFNAFNYVFNSVVIWEDVKEINDKDKEKFSKIIVGIRSNLVKNKIKAMKMLIDDAQELIARIDPKLLIQLDFIIDKLEEKTSSEYDETLDSAEIHQRFSMYEALRNFDLILSESEVLLNDEKITHPMIIIDLWRSRGFAFRETEQTDEAINAFLTSLAYTYENPQYGDLIRILLWGQIASTLRNTGSLFDVVFIELLLARLVLPFRLIQAKREKTVQLDESLEKIISSFLDYSAKIDVYDLCNPLVTTMASIKEYDKAEKLAQISLKNAIKEENVRGQILCNVLLSRLSFTIGDMQSELDYYHKATSLTQFTNDPIVPNILIGRQQPFPNLNHEIDEIEKNSKINP